LLSCSKNHSHTLHGRTENIEEFYTPEDDISFYGNFHFPPIKPAIWTEGSDHIIIGKVEFYGYQLASDPEYPLVFKMIKDSGYTYIYGRGTVITTDGKIQRLGYEDTVDTWLPRLKSDDQLDREAAVQALGWLTKAKEDNDKVMPALIKALEDNSIEVRRDVAETFGRISDSRVIELLNRVAKEDKDAGIRNVAEESLGLIEVKEVAVRLANGDKTAISDLMKILEHSRMVLVLRIAVESLSNGGADAVEPLITKLNSGLYEIRINAAKALAEIGDKRAIEPLKSALAEEKDEDVKKAFEEAIEKLNK